MQQSQRLDRPVVADQYEPLVGPQNTYTTVSDRIGNVILTPFQRTPRGWVFGFAIAFLMLMLFFYAVTTLITVGVGIWGINIPVGWGIDIINFVWWIGIGHAGTLISAILLLLRQDWRTSINRFAEAMTLFAVACAGLYPILHLGRPWLAYWMLPYPNSLGMWANFQSPLEWDVFAISTYASVSLVFWLVGLIPDFAMMRDKAQNIWVKRIFGIAALGWRGSAKHWNRFEIASLILAGLSTPLVVSVHSIVSLDFAAGIVPGWHVTVFPPYFVAGAIYAGFAMVLLLMIPVRAFYRMKDFVTDRHLDVMAKVTLATGLIVTYGYMMEMFFGWYSANPFELALVENRLYGPYAWSYYALLFCNFLAPQVFWFKRMRRSIPVLFIVSLIVSVGMWLERWVIIPVSLTRDFTPSAWGYYTPTVWDWATYIGSFGLFFTLLFLFIRLVPMIAAFEMRHLLHKEHEMLGHEGAAHGPDGAHGVGRPVPTGAAEG
jgi:molybdopterin-containing oxidoreductase family membrane subunit